ncbi:MAG: hypothetical protein M3Z25_04030 [Actinomycetota bacterium]|nr:hypothetical protein [Actinomycetota bacterium]
MPDGPGRGGLASAVAAIVGSLPGFTLPFVAALVLPPGESDLLLLALSVGITPAIIVSSAVELTTVAEYGRLLGRERRPTPAALHWFHWRTVRFAGLLTAVVVPALALAYAARSPERSVFLTLMGAVVATPVISAMAARLSGECIARGAPVAPIAVQAMRSLLPAVLLLTWPDAPVVLVAAMLPVGEAARAAVLGVTCRRLRRQDAGEHTDRLATHGLLAQALSSGVTQLGPAVDRTYLSSSGAGSISSYEMSDRLMYAASQFFTMTFIYRRVAVWARLPTMETGQARHLLRGDARTLGGLALALTVAGASACLAALASSLLPSDWRTGFWWGALVMLSLPAHLFNVVGTRLLVIGRRPRLMLWIAVATAVLNAALDALFYVLLGPVGIVVSTVVLRWTMAAVYLRLLRTVVPATIGQESA